MAWFCNYYTCARCGYTWTDEWSCMCDDDCPECGARHMSPHDSDDLTEVIVPDGDEFVVLWSPETAGHDPDYCELGSFSSRAQAEAFLVSDRYSERRQGG
jgi:predicted  nucleic acid-binding Zn-ribbon protein